MENIKIKLIEPEKIGDEEIKELEFREPLGADLEEIMGEFSTGNKKAIGKALTQLASNLVTSHPLSADDFRKFKAKNYMAVMNEMMTFLY